MLQQNLLEKLHGYIAFTIRRVGVAKLISVAYACLAGIGFIMSLFVAMLPFEDTALVDTAKRGIISGSLLAGIAGALLLRMGRSLRDVN
jgi:Na+/H+ antiporter NhaA